MDGGWKAGATGWLTGPEALQDPSVSVPSKVRKTESDGVRHWEFAFSLQWSVPVQKGV